MKNTTPRCLHCGAEVTTAQIEHFGLNCGTTCAWFSNERATRHIGALRRDADGDWQEDPDGDFGQDHS